MFYLNHRLENKKLDIKKLGYFATVPKGIDLDRILCIKTERSLRNDFTVAHNKKLYQILDNVRAKKVLIEERIDGSLVIRYKTSELKYKEITTRPEKEEPQKVYKFKLRKIYAPPANHPRRKRTTTNCNIKTRHFYFGNNTTFLNWLDKKDKNT